MRSSPILLAHRGAHTDTCAENSVAAFDRALQLGCDGFECDVRRMADGRPVVCHDAKVDGITVSRATPDQLPHLPDVGQVIHRYGSLGFLDIELKVRGLETRVLAALREHPPLRGHVVSSFLPDVVLELKARSGIVPVGLICGKASQLMGWRKLPVEYVMIHKGLMTRRLVQRVQGAGRKIFAWTVNDKKTLLRLVGWGVDGIISDKPQAFIPLLRSPQQVDGSAAHSSSGAAAVDYFTEPTNR